MEIVNYIKYDVARRGVPPVVDAVQGENNARIIEFSLFSNRSAFDVSERVCSLAFSKPDGTSGWYDTMPDGSSAYEVSGNILRIKIAPQVLAVPGHVKAVIRIETGNSGDRTTTFPFIISVSEDPAINAQKSENYYSIQNWDDVNKILPNAILFTPQNLDEAKQKQARKNIGADALIVTVVTINSNAITSHKSTEISDHIKNGGVAYLYADGVYVPISISASGYYAYGSFVTDEGFVDYYEIAGNTLTKVRNEFARASWVEDTVLTMLVNFGIAPVLLDADGAMLVENDGTILINV